MCVCVCVCITFAFLLLRHVKPFALFTYYLLLFFTIIVSSLLLTTYLTYWSLSSTISLFLSLSRQSPWFFLFPSHTFQTGTWPIQTSWTGPPGSPSLHHFRNGENGIDPRIARAGSSGRARRRTETGGNARGRDFQHFPKPNFVSSEFSQHPRISFIHAFSVILAHGRSNRRGEKKIAQNTTDLLNTPLSNKWKYPVL